MRRNRPVDVSLVVGAVLAAAVLVTTRDTLVAPDRQFSLAASIRDAKLWKIDADHLACVNATDQ